MSNQKRYEKSILTLNQCMDGEIYIDEDFESVIVNVPFEEVQIANAWEKRNIDLFHLQEGNFIIPHRSFNQDPLPIYIDELIVIPEFPIAFAPQGITMGNIKLSMLLPIDEHFYATINLPSFQKEKLGENVFLIVAKSPCVFFTLFSEKECAALAYGMLIEDALYEIQDENPIFVFNERGCLDLESTKANLGRCYVATPYGKLDIEKTKEWLIKAKLELKNKIFDLI